ncbi:hypothetical protein IB49_17815 [Geobacillus sp. LC300]|nr:hypothetical protein IB49_17815 [Geobacillus sp. LC300]
MLVKIAGLALFTFGFFGGHSIASAWIGEQAHVYKAQASSLYLLYLLFRVKPCRNSRRLCLDAFPLERCHRFCHHTPRSVRPAYLLCGKTAAIAFAMTAASVMIAW